MEQLKFPGDNEFASILYHDYIIFMGDLNFRLKEGGFNFEEISELVERNEVKPLVEQDQLKAVMSEGRAFQDFGEEEIKFKPTFKFKIGFQVYNKKRRPSYTDRILYRANIHNYEDGLLALGPADDVSMPYKSHPEMTASDHKAVSGAFDTVVFSNETAKKKRTPAFSSDIVTFHGPQDWVQGSEFQVEYMVKQGEASYISEWDWVGLFRAEKGLRSLEDYDMYVWASSSRISAIPRKINFDPEFVHPGRYFLIYFGKNNCVLARSRSFNVSNGVIPFHGGF